jgi:hypothetical protein
LTLKSILDQLKSERERLDRAITILEGSAPRRRGRPVGMVPTASPRRRKLSVEARRKISEAKRKWWATEKKQAKGA